MAGLAIHGDQARIAHLGFVHKIIQTYDVQSLAAKLAALVVVIAVFLARTSGLAQSAALLVGAGPERASSQLFAVTGAFLVFVLWVVDASWQQRRSAYLDLYDDVRQAERVDFDIRIDGRGKPEHLVSALFHRPTCYLYMGSAVAIALLAMIP